MSIRPALRLVERETFEEEGQLWSSNTEDFHSLHYSISYPESFKPGVASSMIERYSRVGEVVLDPFSGRGTTALEAALKGRIPFASDINPLAVLLSEAKVMPADLSEVALQLQRFDLRRPVSINAYREYFEPFYDIDTFREISNLRQILHGSSDRVSRFISMVTLSLLHGHTSGYFSVYTFPQISVSSKVQVSINDRRRQNPDYRAVVPRILRKAAQILRDGGLDSLREIAELGKFSVSDARHLHYVPSGSVSLTLAGPPRPFSKDSVLDLWLRLWFLGVDKPVREDLVHSTAGPRSIEDWLGFMNEVLIEQARVLRPSGRVVFELKEIDLKNADGSSSVVELDQELAEMVSTELKMFFEVESLLKHTQAELKGNPRRRVTALHSKTCGPEREYRVENRLLVLRRR